MTTLNLATVTASDLMSCCLSRLISTSYKNKRDGGATVAFQCKASKAPLRDVLGNVKSQNQDANRSHGFASVAMLPGGPSIDRRAPEWSRGTVRTVEQRRDASEVIA